MSRLLDWPGTRVLRARWMLLLPSLVAVTSCGGATARNPFDGSAPGAGVGERVRIEVQNLNFNDATIWAVRASQRVRVGRVTGKTDQVFSVSWNPAQPIAFEIDVVATRGCRTGGVMIERSSRVWVLIPSDMGYGVCRAGRR